MQTKLPILLLIAAVSAAQVSIAEPGDTKEKLDNIIIPKVQFEDASIKAVFMYLKQLSKDLDPDREGVNFILRLEDPAAAKKPKAKAVDGARNGDNAEVKSRTQTTTAPERTVSLDFDNIPMGDLVRYVCKAGGLKYRVEKHGVLIVHPKIALDRLETRIYPIGPGVFDSRRNR